MRIVSYNLNGIRAALRKGFTEWIQATDPDFIGIQETKAHPEQVDLTEIEAMGYHAHWHSATRRKGYSGVLTLSKTPPDQVEIGCGIHKYDEEGRIIRTDFGQLSIFSCYFPSGTSGEERQAFKMDFLQDFEAFVLDFRRSHPQQEIIVLGDYNIAHTPIDIHDPVRNKKTSGFLPEERAWLDRWYGELGFTDAFRHVHPEKVAYSWWSLRANSRANNKGWRIDHLAVSEGLVDRLTGAYHDKDAIHSDHCALIVDLD